jgi:hypothetical protein
MLKLRSWWSEIKRDWRRTKATVAMTYWNGKGDCNEPSFKDWLWHVKTISSCLLNAPWSCRLSEQAERRTSPIQDWGYEDWNGKPKLAVFIDFYDCYFFVVHIGKFWYKIQYM